MTNKKKSGQVEDETEKLLERVLGNAIRRSRPMEHLDESLDRRRFACGLLLLAPTCVATASLAWVLSDPLSGGLWLCFSIGLLFGASWHFHKASKGGNSTMEIERSRKLRRVQ
jgi:hypothetical protein